MTRRRGFGTRRSSFWASGSSCSGLVPGLVHAFIFWGFVVLLPTILMAMLGAVDRDWSIPWLGGQGWFALMVDVFATLVSSA